MPNRMMMFPSRAIEGFGDVGQPESYFNNNVKLPTPAVAPTPYSGGSSVFTPASPVGAEMGPPPPPGMTNAGDTVAPVAGPEMGPPAAPLDPSIESSGIAQTFLPLFLWTHGYRGFSLFANPNTDPYIRSAASDYAIKNKLAPAAVAAAAKNYAIMAGLLVVALGFGGYYYLNRRNRMPSSSPQRLPSERQFAGLGGHRRRKKRRSGRRSRR